MLVLEPSVAVLVKTSDDPTEIRSEVQWDSTLELRLVELKETQTEMRLAILTAMWWAVHWALHLVPRLVLLSEMWKVTNWGLLLAPHWGQMSEKLMARRLELLLGPRSVLLSEKQLASQ
jgi:hypothetical protein